jgi:hypothetical protein
LCKGERREGEDDRRGGGGGAVHGLGAKGNLCGGKVVGEEAPAV